MQRVGEGWFHTVGEKKKKTASLAYVLSSFFFFRLKAVKGTLPQRYFFYPSTSRNSSHKSNKKKEVTVAHRYTRVHFQKKKKDSRTANIDKRKEKEEEKNPVYLQRNLIALHII